MATSTNSNTPLPPPLLSRDQEAQVLGDEAAASKAAIDAQTAAASLYKALVPDLTGVAANTVTDSSNDIAFSGLVTYKALSEAAKGVANRILKVLPRAGQPTILVTSQSDILTNDLMSRAVKDTLEGLAGFADDIMKATSVPGRGHEAAGSTAAEPAPARHLEMIKEFAFTAPHPGGASAATALTAGLATATTAGLATAAFPPVGLATAAAAAIPAIVSLFSSTTTIKSQSESITDLAATTSVVAAVSDSMRDAAIVHEDFRLAPEHSEIANRYRDLGQKRKDLVLRQLEIQVAKNQADLELSRAEQQQDANKKATPPEPDDPELEKQIRQSTAASAAAAASLSIIASTISGIDQFINTVNATAAGARSPLAIASLNELLWGEPGGSRIDYVLSVKGLGGQSANYTKDRRVGHDTYTTLADASLSFMLYDTDKKKVISSGVVNGIGFLRGRVGEVPSPPAAPPGWSA